MHDARRNVDCRTSYGYILLKGSEYGYCISVVYRFTLRCLKLTSVNKTMNNIVFITDFWMYEMKRPEEVIEGIVIEGQVIEGGIYSGRNLLRESY